MYHFEYVELPRVLEEKGLLPPVKPSNSTLYESPDKTVDLAPLKQIDPPLRLCLGKEWYRFPGHWLVPDGVQVHFIKSDFEGLLPSHFSIPSGGGVWEGMKAIPRGMNDRNIEYLGNYVSYQCLHFDCRMLTC